MTGRCFSKIAYVCALSRRSPSLELRKTYVSVSVAMGSREGGREGGNRVERRVEERREISGYQRKTNTHIFVCMDS